MTAFVCLSLTTLATLLLIWIDPADRRHTAPKGNKS